MTAHNETEQISTANFTAKFARRQKLIDERLSAYIDEADVLDKTLRDAMRYSLTANDCARSSSLPPPMLWPPTAKNT